VASIGASWNAPLGPCPPTVPTPGPRTPSVLGPRGTVGPPYGPKDRGPLVLRAGGGTSGRPDPRPEDALGPGAKGDPLLLALCQTGYSVVCGRGLGRRWAWGRWRNNVVTLIVSHTSKSILNFKIASILILLYLNLLGVNPLRVLLCLAVYLLLPFRFHS